VAQRLDISVGAVKSRIFRARQALVALRSGTTQGEPQ
jgi:DNA-directed RNA polymerase specialized sigma24 family protein